MTKHFYDVHLRHHVILRHVIVRHIFVLRCHVGDIYVFVSSCKCYSRLVNVCHGFVPSWFWYFCHSNAFHAHACHAIVCHAIVTSCKCLSCNRGHVNERPTSASSCVPRWLPKTYQLMVFLTLLSQQVNDISGNVFSIFFNISLVFCRAAWHSIWTKIFQLGPKLHNRLTSNDHCNNWLKSNRRTFLPTQILKSNCVSCLDNLRSSYYLQMHLGDAPKYQSCSFLTLFKGGGFFNPSLIIFNSNLF